MKTSARGTRTHLHRVPSVSWLPDVFEPVPFCKKPVPVCLYQFLPVVRFAFGARRPARNCSPLHEVLATTRH